MSHDANKILLRARDIGYLVGLLTLFGMFFGPMKRVFQMSETIEKVAKLEDKVSTQSENLAVVSSQYKEISKQLDQINWQLRRLNPR